MHRYKSLASLAAVVGLVVFGLGARSQGQVPTAPRLLLDRFAPRPMERGISPERSRAPDSPETRRRLSVQRAAAAADRVGGSGSRYAPGRVIVKFKTGISTGARTAVVAAMSVGQGASQQPALAARPTYADFDVVQIDPAADAEMAARTLRARPDVEYAQAAYRVRPHFTPTDKFYDQQWNLPLIDMNRAWDIQPAAGSAITVAVLDTGVAYTDATMRFHGYAFRDDQGNRYPALGDLTLQFVAATDLAAPGRFVAPHDFIWDDDLPLDLDGHGTHVSGTVGQLTNNDGMGTAGVAFGVKLMPVKVISTEWDDIFGSPNEGTDEVVARGIRYAADNGAQIINMSIGRPGPAGCGTNPDQSGCAPVIEAAITYAVGKGVFIAISAGNDFEDGNPTEVLAEIASRVKGAVSVAAVDREKAHAYYSSSGPWVELAAPGGSFRGFDAKGGILQQTLDLALVETYMDPPARFGAPRFDGLAYYYFSGTSQAAPHVAGLAAMLMQQGITKPAALEAALEQFATDLGASGRDDLFGYGLVEARNSLFGLGLAR